MRSKEDFTQVALYYFAAMYRMDMVVMDLVGLRCGEFMQLLGLCTQLPKELNNPNLAQVNDHPIQPTLKPRKLGHSTLINWTTVSPFRLLIVPMAPFEVTLNDALIIFLMIDKRERIRPA